MKLCSSPIWATLLAMVRGVAAGRTAVVAGNHPEGGGIRRRRHGRAIGRPQIRQRALVVAQGERGGQADDDPAGLGIESCRRRVPGRQGAPGSPPRPSNRGRANRCRRAADRHRGCCRRQGAPARPVGRPISISTRARSCWRWRTRSGGRSLPTSMSSAASAASGLWSSRRSSASCVAPRALSSPVSRVFTCSSSSTRGAVEEIDGDQPIDELAHDQVAALADWLEIVEPIIEHQPLQRRQIAAMRAEEQLGEGVARLLGDVLGDGLVGEIRRRLLPARRARRRRRPRRA